jgi:hypothetical protein
VAGVEAGVSSVHRLRQLCNSTFWLIPQIADRSAALPTPSSAFFLNGISVPTGKKGTSERAVAASKTLFEAAKTLHYRQAGA